MKYNVLIRKCDDAAKAARIIAEIARWSEASQKAVADAWAHRPICVRQSVEEAEANRVKALFEAVGANVAIVQVSHSQDAGLASFGFDMIDEEDGDLGRLLSEKEYADALKGRKDIFIIEKDKRLRNLEIISLVIGLAFGMWLSTVEAVRVTTEYANQKSIVERKVKLAKEIPTEKKKEEDKKKEEERKAKEKKDKEKQKNIEKTKTAHHSGGGGDPRARLARQGVLGLISGTIKGKDVAGADGMGGATANVDAILSGVGGLKAGSSGASGRLAAAGMGFGNGYGSGFGGGGGGGGIDDLIGSLMGGGGGGGGKGESALELKKRKEPLKIQTPEMMDAGVGLTGGRTKASIMRVVMQNMPALRYAYNKSLRDKPGLKGKITIKFAIDEFGKVIFCQVVESTMGDPELETSVSDKIKRWVFDKVDKPGDVTEVTYPFVFSQ